MGRADQTYALLLTEKFIAIVKGTPTTTSRMTPPTSRHMKVMEVEGEGVASAVVERDLVTVMEQEVCVIVLFLLQFYPL